jgi:hypothetical protein
LHLELGPELGAVVGDGAQVGLRLDRLGQVALALLRGQLGVREPGHQAGLLVAADGAERVGRVDGGLLLLGLRREPGAVELLLELGDLAVLALDRLLGLGVAGAQLSLQAADPSRSVRIFTSFVIRVHGRVSCRCGWPGLPEPGLRRSGQAQGERSPGR